MSRRIQPGYLSRPLTPIELIEFTRFVADEVSGGSYPFDFDAAARWYRRIYRDPSVDVWLISWLPSQGTHLHDHGGSSGAFAVVSGQLTEAVYLPAAGPGELREHVRGTGCTVGFGPQYVHDVRNLSDAPAVSVHAYSAPLTAMTYYDLDGGVLRPATTVVTDDPEPALGVRAAS